MALWVCDDRRGGCTTAYSVGAERCPHCGVTAAFELGDETRRDVRASAPAVDVEPEQPAPDSPGPAPRKRARKAAPPGGDGG